MAVEVEGGSGKLAVGDGDLWFLSLFCPSLREYKDPFLSKKLNYHVLVHPAS